MIKDLLTYFGLKSYELIEYWESGGLAKYHFGFELIHPPKPVTHWMTYLIQHDFSEFSSEAVKQFPNHHRIK